MGEIQNYVRIVGLRKDKEVLALLDSGSTVNHIRSILFDGTNIESEIGITGKRGRIASQQSDETEVEGDAVAFKSAELMGISQFEPVFVLDKKLPVDMVIGYIAMQQMGLLLDFVSDRIGFAQRDRII